MGIFRLLNGGLFRSQFRTSYKISNIQERNNLLSKLCLSGYEIWIFDFGFWIEGDASISVDGMVITSWTSLTIIPVRQPAISVTMALSAGWYLRGVCPKRIVMSITAQSFHED